MHGSDSTTPSFRRLCLWLSVIPALALLLTFVLVAGPPAAAVSTPPHVETLVSGPITVPTTWTLAGSPYVVTGTVTVYSDAVLAIEPGVQVRFRANTGLVIGSGGTGGKLLAQGTAAVPITFTADLPGTPPRGYWVGISFNNAQTETLASTLSHCLIEGAKTGLSTGVSDSHTVDQCVFRRNGDPGPLVGGAMRIDGDDLTLTGNEVYDNELGLRLAKSFYDVITGNHIYDNDGFGLGLVVETGPGGSDNLIASNVIHDNGGDGLYLDDGSDNQLRGNLVYGNGRHGVWTNAQEDLSLLGNVVCGNRQDGLQFGSTDLGVPVIHGNVFCRNGDDNLENVTVATLPAEGNWFGTNTPAADGQIAGPVDYTPWISLSLAADPPILPADGVSTAALTLTLSSGLFTVPDGYTFTLGASLGAVSPELLVLDDGRAAATYTAGTVPGEVEIEMADRCATFTATLTLTSYLDLQVTKSAGGLVGGAGEDYTLEYTILVSNTGLLTGTQVVVTDTLPAGALYGGGDWLCAAGRCRYTLGTLAPTATAEITLPVILPRAALTCPLVLVNTVEVAAGNLPDAHPADNTFVLTTTLPCLPDLYVVLNDNIGPLPDAYARASARLGVPLPVDDPRLCVAPGELISYSVAYGNAGLYPASGVVLTETLPPGTSLAGPGWTCVGSTCTHLVGGLAPGAGGILPFVIRVDVAPVGLVIVDEVRIGGNEPDLYPPDNVSRDDTPVCNRCVLLSKSDNTPCAFPGDEIRYTITMNNVCAEPAPGIVLTETLPAYTHYLTSAGWLPLGGGQFEYDYGTLAPLSTATVDFAVVVAESLPVTVTQTTNTVCLGRAGGERLCASDVTPLPLEADLRVVTKDWVGPEPPYRVRRELDRYHRLLYGRPDERLRAPALWDPVRPGDVYSYTITYLNLGRAPATGVVITAVLPAHTHYVGFGWTPVGGRTYVRDVGDLPVGLGGQVNFYVRVDDDACSSNGYLYHWAYIGGDQTECNLNNNHSGEETPMEGPICEYITYLPLVFKSFEQAEPPPPPPPPPPGTGGWVSDVAVNAETNRVYVASPYHDAVLAVNPTAAGSIVAAVSVGENPWGLAVVTTTNKIYVANIDSWSLSAINGSTNLVVADHYVGVQPTKVCADSAAKRVYAVNHLEMFNGAAAVDSEDEEFLYYYTGLHGTQGRYGIEVDPAGGTLFITARDAGLVAIQDAYAPDAEPLWVYPDPPRVPFLSAFNPATGHLFVTTPDDSLVLVLDPYNIELNKGQWLTYNGRQVFVLDRTNAGWVTEIEIGAGAEEGIAVNPVTGRVYVTNRDDDTVSVIQDSSIHADIELLTTIDVGDAPHGIDVDVDRNLVYAGNAGSRDLSVIDGATNVVVKTIPLY